MRSLFIAMSMGCMLISCQESKQEKDEPSKSSEESMNRNGNHGDQLAQTDVDKLIKDNDLMRMEIEDGMDRMEKKSLSTGPLREQVRQKWSEIHFFYDGDQLKRVMTTSHKGASTRTEEFYFKGGELFCAVIEDAGMDELGKESDITGKVYHFHKGEPIAVKDNTGEPDYSIRNSSGERMMQEAKEYLEISGKIDNLQNMVASMGAN